jgi:hypothetical protein
MSKKPPRRDLDETDYTSTLKSAIETYLRDQGEKPTIMTPGARYQGVRKLDLSYPFDLIAKLNEYSLLILEIKIADEKQRLTSFNSSQRMFASALFAAGVPLWYCYNLDRNYEGKPAEATLKLSNTEEPKLVCDDEGRLLAIDSHTLLKLRIDELLQRSGGNSNKSDDPNDDDNGEGPDGNAIGAFFSKEVIESVRDLNTRLLFFLYHTERKEIWYFEKAQLTELVEKVQERFSLKGIDFCSASYEEMVTHFREKIVELSAISAQIRNEIQQEEEQIRIERELEKVDSSPLKQKASGHEQKQPQKQKIQIQM